MPIVKSYNKNLDITYVYDQRDIKDDNGVTHRKRTLIGKLDKLTGEVIPTGKRGRPLKDWDEDDPDGYDGFGKLAEQNKALEDEVSNLKAEVYRLHQEIDQYRTAIRKMNDSLSSLLNS